MELETLKQRIKEQVKDKYTFEIPQINQENWKLTRIYCYCPKHNHKWETAVTSPLYRGSGCPKCATDIMASKKQTSLQTIQEKLKTIEQDKNIKVISQIQPTAIDLQRIQVECKIHKCVWETTLGALLRNRTGCRQCNNIKMSKQRTKSIDTLYTQLKQVITQDIDFKLIYDNDNLIIEYYCHICGSTQRVKTIQHILKNGISCRGCSNKQRTENKKTSFDVRTQKLQDIAQGRYTFKEISFNTLADSKVECTCLECDSVWVTSYENLIRNKTGCKQCSYNKMAQKVAKSQRIPFDECIKRLKESLEPKQIKFEIKEQEYQNQNTIVSCYCPKHNYKWNTSIHSLLDTQTKKGTGCKYCGKESAARKLKAPLKNVIQKLEGEAQGAYKFYIDSYTNMHQKIKCQCTAKGHIWYAKISDLLSKHSKCPYCVYADGASKPEKEILDFIQTFGVSIIANSRKVIPPQELDIYIPELKLAIEFNGTYWHSNEIINQRSKGKFLTAQEYHDYKNEQCNQKGIELIHIAEQDYITDKQKVLEQIKQAIELRNVGYTPATAQGRRLEALKRKCNGLIFLSPYINARTSIKVRHRDCQHEWEVKPINLTRGYSCPYCNKRKQPAMILQLKEYLNTFEIPYTEKQGIFKFQGKDLAINTDTQNKEQGYLLHLTEQYKALKINLIHIFESEWNTEQDLIKSIIRDFLMQGYPTLQQGINIYPYHLYPNLTRFSQPAQQSYGWDCGKAYNDIYQQQCRDTIESHLKELKVNYTLKNNTFKADKLHIKFIPVVEYQNYGVKDLNQFVNNAEVRTMLIYESVMMHDPHQWEVIKSNIAQALGLTKNRIYARKLECVKLESKELKNFFNNNHQYGWIPAQTAFALRDPQTHEIYMSYMLSSGYYKRADVAIVRGACKLGYSIVGGTSKIWKYIVEYYKAQDKHSIVYYVDLNIHNGNSLEWLKAEVITTTRGLWNFWFDIETLKNREPKRYKEIKQLEAQGQVMEVYNAGTRTYLYQF